MFTPQKKNKQTLKEKQVLIKLSPHKYVEHERAVRFIERIPNGMAVHTIVQALNDFENQQKASKTSDEDLVNEISEIEGRLKNLKNAVAAKNRNK